MPKRVRDTRQVTTTRTLFLGALAALAVSCAASLVRSFINPSFSIERWIGDLFLNRSDDFGWNFGFSALLLQGATIGLIYAALFRSAHRSGAVAGLTLAFFHSLMTGVWLTFTRFGFFGSELGFLNASLLFVCHFVYGAVFGTAFDLAAAKRDYPIQITAR